MFAPGKVLFVARNKTAEVLDISGDTVTVDATAPSLHSRSWADATVLANGEVFLSGGIATGAADNSGDYPGEIWNPESGEWSITAKAAKARLYHSTAILLPNARVLVAGGGPPGPVVNMNAEVFIPPYLFDDNGSLAQRPVITQTGLPTYASAFFAEVDSNTTVSKVSFVRSGSATHSFDQSQRYMELPFEQTGNTLNIRAPQSPNIAPPGLYMLFVFDQNGVPSHASLMTLGGEQAMSSPVVDNTDPADTDPNNLLVNGGFEADKDSWIACSAANLSQVSNTSSHGEKALRQSNGACLYQEISVTPGATYTLSCDAFLDGDGFSSIDINMLDSAYNELSNDTVAVSATAYQAYEQTIQAPADAQFSAITLYSEGPTFFDSCIVVSDQGSDTPSPVSIAINPPADNLLSNSDFSAGQSNWIDCAAQQLTSVEENDGRAGSSLKIENAGCVYQEFPVQAGKQYEMQCVAKSEDARYTSITLQISDERFAPLNDEISVVAAGAFDLYRSTIATPENGSVGSITLYSEDISHFDACYVSEL